MPCAQAETWSLVPFALSPKIITKTGELPRQPTTHPEETEEELTEQQEGPLEEPVPLGQGSFAVDGSTESESTQDDLEEDDGCVPLKDNAGESGAEEEHTEVQDVAYKQVSSSLLCPGFVLLPQLAFLAGFECMASEPSKAGPAKRAAVQADSSSRLISSATCLLSKGNVVCVGYASVGATGPEAKSPVEHCQARAFLGRT